MKPPAPRSNSTMDHLADRIRDIVGDDPRVSEKTMFGGLTFLLDGHILVGCKKDGRILLSVGKDHHDEALGRAGATPMIHNARTMRGFIWVEGDAIEDDDDLRGWVEFAHRWVSQMPGPAPKRAPARKAAAKKAAAKAARSPRTPARR